MTHLPQGLECNYSQAKRQTQLHIHYQATVLLSASEERHPLLGKGGIATSNRGHL